MGAERVAMWGCPDGARCHHGCVRWCWRVLHAGPLSGAYPGDRWPLRVLQAHEVARTTEELAEMRDRQVR